MNMNKVEINPYEIKWNILIDKITALENLFSDIAEEEEDDILAFHTLNVLTNILDFVDAVEDMGDEELINYAKEFEETEDE